jgi:hypothetical protein
MGGMSLVRIGGPGGRSEHNPLDALAYTVHEWTYDSAEYASFRKRLVKGLALFSAPPERENTGEDGEVGKIGVAQFLAKSSSKCDVTHQFLCTVVDHLVAFFWPGETVPREHSETVLHHDEIGE